MEHKGLTPHKSIVIDELFSIHYFEYTKQFTFDGESHDFWEFVCVDKGQLLVIAGDKEFVLESGDIYFHKPNEFHNVKIIDNIESNSVIITFSSLSEGMDFFRDKKLSINNLERQLLGSIIKASTVSFTTPLNNPYENELLRAESAPWGNEQIIVNTLELFLLTLAQRHHHMNDNENLHIQATTKSSRELAKVQEIIEYFERNLHKNLSLVQICEDNDIGRTQLFGAFKYITSTTPTEYFSQMRINKAKELIRTEPLNFTEIAERLGYSSVYYFSKKFKHVTNMSPSEYAESIKIMFEQ